MFGNSTWFGRIVSYLEDGVYNMKTWKQEFLVMVYISITTAFRSRGKGHLAYYMRLLHGDSLALSFPLSSRTELEWAYKENPYNTQTMPRHFSYHGIDRGLGASQAF